MKILVYQDYIHNHHVLFKALENSFGNDNVSFVDATEIIEEGKLVVNEVGAFVMPGGADLYYTEKLNGPGNEAIREYVKGGGVYVGICAGSYYGCSSLQWAEKEDNGLRINGSRELAFFNGVGVGPVYEFLEENNINKQHSNAVQIVATAALGDVVPLIKYSGGPIFIPNNPEDNSFEVIGRYKSLENEPIAILKSKFGKGMALLISPHIEDSGLYNERKTYELKNNNPDRSLGITAALKEHEYNRNKLWTYLMNLIINYES